MVYSRSGQIVRDFRRVWFEYANLKEHIHKCKRCRPTQRQPAKERKQTSIKTSLKTMCHAYMLCKYCSSVPCLHCQIHYASSVSSCSNTRCAPLNTDWFLSVAEEQSETRPLPLTLSQQTRCIPECCRT